MIEVFLEYLGTCKIDLLLSYEKPVIDLFYLLNLNIIKCLLPKNIMQLQAYRLALSNDQLGFLHIEWDDCFKLLAV